MTTDLQRMNQDEWLAALRSGQYTKGTGGQETAAGEFCGLEVGVDVLGGDTRIDYFTNFTRLCGVSLALAQQITALNDGWRTHNPLPGHKWSFDEIADWFKAERDTHAGDLSLWEMS